MPFSATASITSTDMNNMLRGLVRDNADHSVTGTLVETDLFSTSITANTIGATGCLHLIAMGTITGAAGNKQMRVYFGGTLISDSGAAAGTSNWGAEIWIFNTATNAQRIKVLRFEHTAVTTQTHGYLTASIDTTANVTLKVTGTLTNAADTITQTLGDVFVAQIT